MTVFENEKKFFFTRNPVQVERVLTEQFFSFNKLQVYNHGRANGKLHQKRLKISTAIAQEAFTGVELPKKNYLLGIYPRRYSEKVLIT